MGDHHRTRSVGTVGKGETVVFVVAPKSQVCKTMEFYQCEGAITWKIKYSYNKRK